MIYSLKSLKTRISIGACLFCLTFLNCNKFDKEYEVSSLKLLEIEYKKQLEACISYLDTLKSSKDKVEVLKYYQLSRKEFKKLEPILAFVDKENYKYLNAPNILKIEEEDATDIKVKKPKGFQVLEEQIFKETTSLNDIKVNSIIIKNRLSLILKNTYLNLKPHHIIWLLRDEIARIALTGITGFDSPVLEQSLTEAQIVYQEIENILNHCNTNFNNKLLLDEWKKEIALTKTVLEGDFNSFNRYSYIKNHVHKQLNLLVETQKDWNVVFPFELAFKNEMNSLFSNTTFNVNYFSDNNSPTQDVVRKIALGKQLFSDKNLSLNGVMSCATCHQKNKAFSDGLKAFPKQKRNTPTLRYSALQKSFFYDGRAGSLEGQIVSVIDNKDEFHSDLKTITNAVIENTEYVLEFNTLYGKITDREIRHAIATYIRSLNTFNSKFDRNINNKENSLSTSEINGFNTFSGKGKCATCHFAPVFNGTVPPNFTESELESIGVPKTKGLEPEISDDLGRFHLFNTKERKHFFKTPTIRNIEKTFPYMHNGVYNTLEEVMTFYNNGGASGLGINLKGQTLPSDSLKLSKEEINDIISFMKTLNDD